MAYAVQDSYEANTVTGVGLASTWIRTQTFTAGSSYVATAISVKCAVISQPGSFSGGIYATVAGKPSGSALATFTLVVTLETGSFDWSAITALSSGISLTSGTKYALVINGASGETFYWYTDDSVGADGYTNGEPFVNTGSGWVVRHSPNNWSDHSFRIYSTAVFAPPSDMITYKRLVAAANSKIWYEDI